MTKEQADRIRETGSAFDAALCDAGIHDLDVLTMVSIALEDEVFDEDEDEQSNRV